MQLKPINTFAITLMLSFALITLFLTGFIEFPSANPSISSAEESIFETLTKSTTPEPFKDVFKAFKKWDSQVGCARFREKHGGLLRNGSKISSLQNVEGEIQCGELQMNHRRDGDPLRVYMDLEAGRKRSGYEDIFIGYHAKDDVQSTYAGAVFHNNRNYHLSSIKNNNTLVYWSSSRCLPQRNQLAKKLLSLLPHHSFGKCLNNVGGLDMALTLYPECVKDANEAPKWWDHLHCAMSNYKFVLAIENTMTESYVTEKLFYALDSGSVPIYFGAPNVWDFIPPHSIIDGTKFSSIEQLASYVKSLANDPVAYAEYHAWRRCGVLVMEKVVRDCFASIASSSGQDTSSDGVNPQLSVPPPSSHVGSPLFWIGVGVGLSALFSWVASRVKVSDFLQGSDTSGASTPVASQSATVDVPATKVEDPPSISVKDKVESEKGPKKYTFVDVSPEETLQKNAFESYKEPTQTDSPNDTQSSEQVSQNGMSAKQGTGASEGPSTSTESPLMSVEALEKMMEDPTVQQMVYPYLPEEMRNPTTFKYQIGLTPKEVISKIMANPDVAMAFQNPRVQAAIMDCSQNPLSTAKYQNDKEVMDVFNKISELFPGASGY
ncbi:hypothetical protein BUALT_Bualt01G0003500 [Buddleja alternifolia]|uniref:Fucosyltransferase n=1 Tax=Buddleja alternifolia TaxID=168488 RepID=A0AAV6Y7H1_9LAMI|nr:hypothetical protein BUALT_Bualt01G0003500 [Buddleja alternifolia]